MSQWLVNQLSSATHNQLFATLLNSSLPVQPAMAILRLSALPKMGYLLRTIKPSITAKAAALFDAKVIETAIAKLRLPHNLSSGAHLQLTLPFDLVVLGCEACSDRLTLHTGVAWLKLHQIFCSVLAMLQFWESNPLILPRHHLLVP
jgi:hypothetical protein